jgi:hypothetical protein
MGQYIHSGATAHEKQQADCVHYAWIKIKIKVKSRGEAPYERILGNILSREQAESVMVLFSIRVLTRSMK